VVGAVAGEEGDGVAVGSLEDENARGGFAPGGVDCEVGDGGVAFTGEGRDTSAADYGDTDWGCASTLVWLNSRSR
jgi:hypothetical protein